MLEHAERLKLQAGGVLFSAGEKADSLFLVLSGTLGVYEETIQSHRLISLVRSGESVGEMAMLSETDRSATVVALRDCDLLKISRAHFDQLVLRFPILMREMSRQLIDRLRWSSQTFHKKIEPKTTALLPGIEQGSMFEIAHTLGQAMRSLGMRVMVISPPLHDENFSREISKLELLYDHVLLYGAPQSYALNSICARHSDRVVVFSRAERPFFPPVQDASLKIRADHNLLDFVLLESKKQTLRDTNSYLKELPFSRQFHIQEQSSRDWARLARVLSGRAIGIVLSGGGARAYAHLGVLKALQEVKIPIDFIGGVSMGALIGACVAMGWSFERIFETFRESFVKKNPLSDYSLPLVGLIKGKKVEALLEKHFGEVLIEDLPLPFFCLSSNLTTGKSERHFSGKLREALRASVSLPGILPPLITEQGILVDGGVINNLPVDAMQTFHKGCIIASDVTRDLALTPEWLQGEYNKIIFARMLKPPLISLLIRAGTVSSEASYLTQQQEAALVIAPPLGKVDLRDWKALEKTANLGYIHALEVLKKWKQ